MGYERKEMRTTIILLLITALIICGIKIRIQDTRIHTLEVTAALDQEHMKQIYFGMKDLSYQIDVLTQRLMEE